MSRTSIVMLLRRAEVETEDEAATVVVVADVRVVEVEGVVGAAVVDVTAAVAMVDTVAAADTNFCSAIHASFADGKFVRAAASTLQPFSL